MKKLQGIYRLLIPSLLLLATSCQPGKTVYEKYEKMENMGWGRFNILKFEMPVEDTEKEVDFFINIRHIPEIPYKSMEVNFTLYTPGGDMRTSNLVLPLIDRDGNHLSKCMGDLCDLEVPLRKNFRFSEKGMAHIEIENRYTKINMPGIIEVGLIVKESQGK